MDPRALLTPLAVLYVGFLRRRRDVDGLIGALRRQTLRPDAARTLGGLGDPRASGPLLSVLDDPASRGRPECARALGRLGAAESIEALVTVLRRPAPEAVGAWHPDRQVRTEAALALGRIGDQRALEALVDALDDRDPQLGSAAAGALVELGDSRAPNPPLAAHEREVLATVREVVDPLVALGAATLEVVRQEGGQWGPPPPVIEVRPTNPDACRISVQVDLYQQVSLFMGEPTWCETWHDDRAEYLRWVREAVEAVTEGRYEEWAHQDGRQAKGVFHLPGGPKPFYDNVIRVSAVGGPGWQHRSYAPYRGAALSSTDGA